ncbi:MAG: VOC family protein [Thermoanaerobaculia bacterium]|nr:VOC family protein [Thermoanaerobaculia bacterium]
MISGCHAVIYSADPEADRGLLRDVLGLPHVDAGGGWLIFGLPPAEVAVHPTEEARERHEVFLMCDDLAHLRAVLQDNGVASSPPVDTGWGLLSHLALPGGGRLGVYQPKHARPAAR